VSAEEQATPVTWSATENLRWKVELPGPGSSSPIIVGDKVFVTCWSGYGTDRGDAGDQKDLRRHLVCLDRATGKVNWDKKIEPYLPEDQYGGMFAEHGYASHTPASDGENVYVYFGKTGALAYDMDGNQLWQTQVGTESGARGWGSASSPILYKDLVIITATSESEALVALNKKDGKEVWRQEAAGFSMTWGTPVLVEVDENRTDLVLGVPYEIWGFNPETGKLRWYCEAMDTESYCSSVVASDGIVYGIEGRGGGSIAVKVGGKGDVTDANVVWSGRDSNRIGTPVIYDGRIYFFSGGIANCIEAKDGKKVFQGRLEGSSDGQARGGQGGRPDNAPDNAQDDRQARDGNQDRQRGGQGGVGGRGGFGGRGGGGFGGDYSSPILADGKIYFVSRGGDMFVLKASAELEQLAVNRVTSDREDFSATPAVSHGQLFVRSSKHLYCIGAADGE
jgi:outer membrane protein assembly factor BamB